MKIVVQVRLFPDAAQQTALRATLDLCNEAANYASAEAYGRRVVAKQALQRLTYARLKDRGLSAQPAIQVARKVAGAYAHLEGRHPRREPRQAWIETAGEGRVETDHVPPGRGAAVRRQVPVLAAPARTVSIWTTAGRLLGVRFDCSDQQYATLTAHRKGESDLVCRDGKWYLYATCDLPDTPIREPDGFLGVDLGIATIATTSDGTRHCGKGLNRVRHRNQRLRAKLQKIGTKSAKRLLRKRARKEARFAADTSHRIAKRIVTEAERTGRGIALEDRGGIRDRVRLRRPQRVTLHSWAFHQLGTFVAYKAARAGWAAVSLPNAA